MMLPSLFLSHGAPTLPLTDTPARSFLSGLGGRLPRPSGFRHPGPCAQDPRLSRLDISFSAHPELVEGRAETHDRSIFGAGGWMRPSCW